MVYDYVITLKKSDYRFIDQVSQLMLLFAFVIFCYYYYLYFRSGVFYLIIAIGIIGLCYYSLYRKRKDGYTYFRLALLLSAVGWFLSAERNIWMGSLYALAGLLEKQVKFPQEIGFSKDDIVFNTFPKKRLQWNDVSNVLIKDGLITIDQKNNKLFQKEINEAATRQVEIEFNEYCRQQINSGQSM